MVKKQDGQSTQLYLFLFGSPRPTMGRFMLLIALFFAILCAGSARKAGVAGIRNDEVSEFPSSSSRKGPQEMTIRYCSS